MEHTKGPWESEGTLIFGTSVGGCQMEESTFLVAQARGWGHLQYLGEAKAVAEQEANAHLIAAAPDLLEACNDAMEALDFCTTSIYKEDKRKQAIVKLMKALAKAEAK